MRRWGNGLICLVDFLNFSFRNALCDGGCSPFGLAILRSLKMNYFRSASIFLALRARNMPFTQNEIFRSASIFLALRARNAAILQMKFFVPHPIFLALRARNIGCVSEKQRGPLFFILLRSRRIDSKLSSAAFL